MDVSIVAKNCLEVLKLEIEFYHGSFKVVEFMMELHHEHLKGGEAQLDYVGWT